MIFIIKTFFKNPPWIYYLIYPSYQIISIYRSSPSKSPLVSRWKEPYYLVWIGPQETIFFNGQSPDQHCWELTFYISRFDSQNSFCEILSTYVFSDIKVYFHKSYNTSVCCSVPPEHQYLSQSDEEQQERPCRVGHGQGGFCWEKPCSNGCHVSLWPGTIRVDEYCGASWCLS